MLFYRFFIIENFITKAERAKHIQIAEIYKKTAYDKYRQHSDKFMDSHYNKLAEDKVFNSFAIETLNFFKTLNVVNIVLYNIHGSKILAANQNKIDLDLNRPKKLHVKMLEIFDKIFKYKLINNYDNILYHKNSLSQVKGRILSSLVLSSSIRNDNLNSNANLFITYIPLLEQNKILGVLEIITDISYTLDHIDYLEGRIAFTFGILLLGLAALIAFNTAHVEKILTQKFQENKNLEEARIKAESENAAKTQFLANITHELRTPLNAIIGFSDLILSNLALEPAKKQEYLQDINTSGKHLLSVINDILDFSKASVDKLKIEIQELDLNKLITSSIKFVEPRAMEAKITLNKNMPEDHIILKADPKRLKQALINLLSNSVKFTPEGGIITVIAEEIEEQIENLNSNVANQAQLKYKTIRIKVIDTGIGIEEKNIPKALSSFGQIDNKFSKKYEGTGLGLPLTKKLVELMGGIFILESQYGKGTCITLTFKSHEL